MNKGKIVFENGSEIYMTKSIKVTRGNSKFRFDDDINILEEKIKLLLIAEANEFSEKEKLSNEEEILIYRFINSIK